jgi:hypothetical protein
MQVCQNNTCVSLPLANAGQPTCANDCSGNGGKFFKHYLISLMVGIGYLTLMFTFNRSVMRMATVTVLQDGNVQIVRKRTMVQVEASTVVSIVRLLIQQQRQQQPQQQQHQRQQLKQQQQLKLQQL